MTGTRLELILAKSERPIWGMTEHEMVERQSWHQRTLMVYCVSTW